MGVSYIPIRDKPLTPGGMISEPWRRWFQDLLALAIFTTDTIVFPSGDTSGATDLTNIQAAINGLPVTGGRVTLAYSASAPGPFYINGAINIGNGTASAWSTRNGVELVGMGAGGIGLNNPGFGGVKIIGTSTTTAMIKINGPLSGWSLKNLYLQTPTGTGAISGLHVFSGQNGYVKNLAIDVCGPTQNGIYTTTQYNQNTMNNIWKNIRVNLLSGATGAVSAVYLGSGDDATSNTCWDTWEQLMIYPTLVSQYGLYLKGCDTVSFMQYGRWGGVACQVVTFDYTGLNLWPCDIHFFGCDTSLNGIWANGGTPNPPAGATNKVYGFGTGNGATVPSLANLVIINS